MRDVRRLTWCACVLLATGCQSLPTGSATLFDLTADSRESTESESTTTARRALFSLHRREVAADAADAPKTIDAELAGQRADDEVLRTILEREFADASDAERQAWIPRLANASEDEIPQLLAERRRAINARQFDTAASSTGQNSAMLHEPAAQPIILTKDRSGIDTAEATTSGVGWDGLGERTAAADHPLRDRDTRLSAPAPGQAAAPTADAPPVVDDADDRSVEVVASIFDVFGVGGERQAALGGVAGTSSIRPAGHSREKTDGVDESAASTINLESAKALQSVYWQEDLDKLIALLEAQVAHQEPGEGSTAREYYIRQHVALRMLYLIASRRPEALQAIPRVPHDEQEFWTHMFWALSSAFDDEAMPNSAVRAAETVAQLREAVRQLESRAVLQLHRTTFCQQINGFGDYLPFEDDAFTPGQPVLVYTEVRNFQSQSTMEGDYRTVLRSSITIRSEGLSGPIVFRNELPETEDRCKSLRQDYFHSYRLQLPTTLQPGSYVLSLEVTDSLTGKTASSTLNFVIR